MRSLRPRFARGLLRTRGRSLLAYGRDERSTRLTRVVVSLRDGHAGGSAQSLGRPKATFAISVTTAIIVLPSSSLSPPPPNRDGTRRLWASV